MAMAALMTLLAAIDDEHVHKPVVIRELRQPDQVNEWPTVCIKEDEGSEFESTEFMEGVGTEAILTERFNVVIYGHVRSDGMTLASTALLRLRHAIREKLVANMSLGGIARGLDFGREEVDGGLIEPRGLWVQPLTVVLDQKFVTD
jgi:hypothetical protein